MNFHEFTMQHIPEPVEIDQFLLDDAFDFVVNQEPERQMDAFADFVYELGKHLGGAWGYGHIGNDPAGLAHWGLVGEATWADPHAPDGAPSLWNELAKRYYRDFGTLLRTIPD